MGAQLRNKVTTDAAAGREKLKCVVSFGLRVNVASISAGWRSLTPRLAALARKPKLTVTYFITSTRGRPVQPLGS
jgi:hypothetical protein